jgi:hypothetical protein
MSGRESTPYDVLRSSSLQCRETYNAGAVEHVN